MQEYLITEMVVTADDDFLKIHGLEYYEGAFWIQDYDNKFIVPVVNFSMVGNSYVTWRVEFNSTTVNDVQNFNTLKDAIESIRKEI